MELEYFQISQLYAQQLQGMRFKREEKQLIVHYAVITVVHTKSQLVVQIRAQS